MEQLRARAARVPATTALIAANLVVFAATLVAGAGLWHAPNTVQLAWGANFGPATKDGEWWRLFSAMFLHFGLLHLVINMVALAEAGRFVERMLGSGRFLLLYLAGGLAGNLLSLVVQGDRGISGGASGAVFAVFGALLEGPWRERHALDPREFRWLFGGAGGLTAANILLGAFIPGIDQGAHLGGFAAGVLAAVLLTPGRPGQAAEPPLVRTMAAIVLAAATTGLLAIIPAPAYDWTDEQAARSEILAFVGTDADISSRWGAIVDQGRRDGSSFGELAARIDSEVAGRYEASFEQLSSVQLDPRAPSAATVSMLRRYAEMRRDAAHGLAEGLRKGDARRVEQALALARSAGELAREGVRR